MLTDAQVLAEWKRRRTATWRAIRFALSVLGISGGAFWYLASTPGSDMTGWQLLATFLIFIAMAVVMLVVITRTLRNYRCPRCNSVLLDSYESGIVLNPKQCGRCSAVLRESH